MQLELTKPEVERFIDAQIKAGHFTSAEAVVEAGLARLMSDVVTSLDSGTLEAVDAAEDQIERGEYREWKEASAELRARFLGR